MKERHRRNAVNKGNFFILLVVVGLIVVVGALFAARGAGGGTGENGTPAPSPTAPVSTPTVAPSMPTATPSSVPGVTPSPIDTPVPVATITIRALENPYRFEPNTVTIKAGTTYTLELVGGEEQHDFVANNTGLSFYEIIPAHGLVTKVFTAPSEAGYYGFSDPSHKKYGMGGVFIVTDD